MSLLCDRLWHCYIVECSDHTYYTGIALDVVVRVNEHNGSPRGARYTKGRRPVVLLASSKGLGESEARRLERHIKSRPRRRKVAELLKWSREQGR